MMSIMPIELLGQKRAKQTVDDDASTRRCCWVVLCLSAGEQCNVEGHRIETVFCWNSCMCTDAATVGATTL